MLKQQTVKPLLLIAAMVLAVAGCGVRGPLDPPTQAQAEGHRKREPRGAMLGIHISLPPGIDCVVAARMWPKRSSTLV